MITCLYKTWYLRAGKVNFKNLTSMERVMDPLPPARRRDAKRTKAAILAAAIAEFSKNGAAGTRVDEIAASAGVNKSLIYQYFGSKQELYTEVLTTVFANAAQRSRVLAETCLADTTLRGMQEVVERFLTLHLRMLDEIPEYPRLLAWENLDGGKTLARPQVKKSFMQLQEYTAAALRTFEARGLLEAKIDSRLGLLSTMALTHYYSNYKALTHEMLKSDQYDDNTIRYLWIKHCASFLSAQAVR